jgi:hypothetical protein
MLRVFARIDAALASNEGLDVIAFARANGMGRSSVMRYVTDLCSAGFTLTGANGVWRYDASVRLFTSHGESVFA